MTETASLRVIMDAGTAVEIYPNLYCCTGKVLCEKRHIFEGYEIQMRTKRRLAVKLFHIKDENSDWFQKYRGYLDDIFAARMENPSKLVTDLVKYGMMNQQIDGDNFFIAMPLCKSKTLADINLETVSWENKKKIFLQICHAVAELHQEPGATTTFVAHMNIKPTPVAHMNIKPTPVAHMNIKPSNILFSRDGRNVVLSDSGLKRKVNFTEREGDGVDIHQSVESYSTSPGWAAPEMCQNCTNESYPKDKESFFKCDIFSLGILGFYIFCDKHHPFASSADQSDLDRRDVSAHVNLMSFLATPDLSPLESKSFEKDLLMKMIDLDPKSRPSIQDVLGHPMFWSIKKKVRFLKDTFSYLVPRNSRQEESATLRMLYIPLSDQATSEEEENMLRKLRKVISTRWIKTTEEVYAKHWENLSHETRKKAIECRIEARDNSVFELLRFLRNCAEHASPAITPDDWLTAFPKLVPFLVKIMEPVLPDDYKAEYIYARAAIPNEINVQEIHST